MAKHKTHAQNPRVKPKNHIHKRKGGIDATLDSTCLDAISWDRKSKTLDVAFVDGSVASYGGISRRDVRDLLDAGSPGREFNANIRD